MENVKQVIGKQVRIEYYDQNKDFAKILPQTGTIKQKLKAKDGADNWFLVELSKPFEYQIKVGEPYQFKLIKCKEVLVRSRWVNQEVGDEQETSVFILLITDDKPVNSIPFDIDNFYHAAWGMCYTENK